MCKRSQKHEDAGDGVLIYFLRAILLYNGEGGGGRRVMTEDAFSQDIL